MTEPTPVLRRIVALAAPTTLISAMQIVSQLAEAWLAARQGTVPLAGWALVLPFSMLMQQMSAGAMGGGVVSAIARALGGGRAQEASALVLHAVVIATIAAAGFGALLAIAPRAVLGMIGGVAPAEAAASYAVWLFGVGALPAWLANTLASVLRGGGQHALVARLMMGAWLALPVLSWLLMEPMGMGLAGLGAAYALVFWVAAAAMAAVVLKGRAGFRPSLQMQFHGALFRQILQVGLVACGLATVAHMTTVLVTRQIAWHGAAAVAAYGISARLEFVIVPLAFGVGSALTALVGRAVGAKDWPLARRIAWQGGLIALAMSTALGVTVSIFSAPVAAAFSHDPAVIAVAERAFRIIGPAYSLFGLGMALYFAAMGAGRMVGPTVAGLSRMALGVGGGWVLADVAGLGLTGNFLAVAAGITAYGVTNALAVRTGVWRATAG